ncbi:LuxR C-terminal-related transcriptional regulator [Cellulomonas sp. NPDC089187]|uniref:helix-turn-helix transcriptional regulator n=1 Tax=Cellulomonas sp. NPDC089187 TaxID=3154970 RepID=UPI00341BF53B
MTFCHSTLLDHSLDAIASRESVVILGRPLSGRTTLLHAIAQHLREAGHEPVFVRGVPGLESALSALDLAQVSGAPPKGQESLLGAAYNALVDRLRQHDQALLVDDLDDLDAASLALLQHAAARTRVPVVATGQSRGRVRADLPFPTALRLDMRPLTFEDCAELMADVLGGAVESATVARLMTKTAGLPGLMVRFASAARRAGKLIERGGVWQGTSDLWSPGISRVVSAFVAGLPEPLVTAATRLAQAGAVDIENARTLVGEDALLELEDRRLIEVAAPVEGHSSVALSPPLLAQYLQREVSPLARALSTPDEGWATDLRGQLTGTPSVTPLPASEAALIQERQRAEHAAAQAAWEIDRSPDHARELLDVMISRGVDRREIVDVLERTDLSGADDSTILRYLDTVARWRAWVDNDLPAAIEALQDAAGDGASEQVRTALLTLGRHLESVGAQPPTDDAPHRGERVVPDPLVTSTPDDSVAPALAAVIEGDGPRALAALADLPETTDGHTLAVRRTLEVQAIALGGDLDAVVAKASAYRDAAVTALEPFGIAMHSHEAAKGLFFQGRYGEAEAVLDEALTIGVPPFPHMPLHVANLTMFAVLQARRGRFDLAEATQRQAERFGVVHSYSLLGSTAWSRAYIDALRDGDETLDALWESGLELERRGFLPAALAVWTLAVAPWNAERLVHIREVAGRVSGDLFTPMISYHQALTENRSEALEKAYQELRAHGRPFFAGVAARAMAAVHRHDEVLAEFWRARANDLAEEVGCAALDLAPGRSLRAAVTPREQDILRLVVAGRSNAEIAASCFLSVRTVENHVHRIIRKLGVSSRAELGEVWK